MDFQFKVNKKYTLLMIGVCYREEVTILEVDEEFHKITGKRKGKKTPFILPSEEHLTNSLIFEGHDLPLVLDSETSRFAVNGCINFRTDDPHSLRDYLERRCLNPTPATFAKICWHPVAGSVPSIQDPKHLFIKPSDIF